MIIFNSSVYGSRQKVVAEFERGQSRLKFRIIPTNFVCIDFAHCTYEFFLLIITAPREFF